MKRFVYAALCVVSLCLGGCGYDDDEVWNAINDQEERIAALEEWQKTANENIAALQAIVNGNDYITSVEEIKEGDEIIGYTINFHRQGEVTIYNGKDGEKGDMPVIGVSEGEDGRWYWTVNGELLEDADGNPVCANGKDGEDGEDGEDGADGSSSSGVTPVIKLGSELGEDYNQYASYISVDGGRTWTQINVALDWLGGVLESIEQYSGYYLFKFSENKWGYNSTIQIPIYSGGLELSCVQEKDGVYHYTNISNGVLSVNAGEAFTIECHLPNGGNLEYTLEQEENVTKWEIEKEEKDSWNINLNFAAIENPGTAKLKLTLVLSNNEVTYYQVEITAYEAQTIDKEDNPALVEALANSLGTYILNEEGDVEITPQVIQNTTSLYISDQNITSLKGIEAFENLEVLNCSNNPLTSLDVSAFSELKELNCDNCFNQSSASRSYSNGVLDLSANIKLQTLSCTDNGLTGLILPDTQTLSWINCSNNQLTSLDVSKNTSLNYLSCMSNQLETIDVSLNTALTFLELDNNQFVNLDISQNTLLETLWVPNNKLIELNISSNESLARLYCYGNRLTQLDISNNLLLQDLNCGSQYTSDNSNQQLILTINESQQALWESSWKGNNYNVILADGLVHSSGGSGSNFGNGGVY